MYKASEKSLATSRDEKVFPPKIQMRLSLLRSISQSTRRFSVSEFKRQIPSLHTFTDDEKMLREAVAKFATDVVGPKVFPL